MTLQSLLLLLGTAALALAAPHAPTTAAPTAAASSSPPLPESSAKSIFQNGNVRLHPDAAPNLIQPNFKPPPAHPSVTGPTVSRVQLSAAATPVINAPGLPANVDIKVGVEPTVPISQFFNQSLTNTSPNNNSTLSKRQCAYPNCCPDPRYLSESTSFPYSVMGKWTNPYGSCSGTLVGPRHVLIASHCIDWNGANSWTGSLTFYPESWPGHNIGTYTSSLLIRYDETPENGVTTDFNIAFDYVIAVLDSYPNIGWLGSKTYSTSWNNLNAWYQYGYAANAGGTVYPYAQGPFEIIAEVGQAYQSDILEYTACATPGDSGSSVFGWWSDGPYLVGVVTWQGSLPTGSARNAWGPGGANLPNLINVARTDHP